MLGMEQTIQWGVTRSRAVIHRLRQLPDYVGLVLRATAFWLAVVLPAVYLPLLFVESTWSTSIVSVLLVVHILTVLGGAEYEPDS